MNLKTATTLALIGSIITVIVHIIYFLNSYQQDYKILGIPGQLISILGIMSQVLLLLFFIALHNKQQ